MIELSHVAKSYLGVRAVEDISFTVQTGEICGLLGPNGAGKSTTMNIMCGCLAATSGEVRYDGLEIYADMREVKSQIGYLPETPPLYPELTVGEYLTFVGRAKGLQRSEVDREAAVLMGECGLTEMRDRLIRSLSKGYRQRVGIAQALMGNPAYVILDEPTVGLDPVQIVEIRALIKRLAGERTVLVSSHILSEVRQLADHIVMISHGRVVADDTPENLEAHAAGPVCITVTAEASEAMVLEAIGSVAGAAGCEVSAADEPGCVVAHVTAAPGADLRAPLSRELVAAGAIILGMQTSTASLEDVFLELAGEEAEGAEGAVTAQAEEFAEPADFEGDEPLGLAAAELEADEPVEFEEPTAAEPAEADDAVFAEAEGAWIAVPDGFVVADVAEPEAVDVEAVAPVASVPGVTDLAGAEAETPEPTAPAEPTAPTTPEGGDAAC